MAIFYNHIKGCGINSTGSVNSTTDLWTWIKWGDATLNDPESGDGVEGNIIEKYYNYLPKIYLNYTNSFPTDEDYCLGHILTTDAQHQYITNNFEFKSNVACKGALEVTGNISSNNSLILGYGESGNASSIVGIDRRHHLTFKNQSAVWFFNDTATIDLAKSPHGWGDYGAIYKNNDNVLTVESSQKDSTGENFVRQSGYFAFSSITVDNNGDKNDAEFIIRGKCEALYFNATSDRRAKTNITPAEFSALHVVNSIPTYTFNYNNKEEKTIGLIAQEAAEFNLDGFSMVDNLEATGVNGDFMQMKESKLVYILWKAVQELSAEVEELKAEIRNLK